MKIADTISVNPGKAALGHVNEEARGLLRMQVLKEKGTMSEKADITRVLFPGAGSGTATFRKYSLPMRALFATILIVSGLTILQGTTAGSPAGYGIAMMTAGGMLAIGFLTRPIMAIASLFFAIAGAISLRAGVVDMNMFGLMFGSLIFAVTGSGKYSADSAIVHNLGKKKSYKAFAYAR